MPTFPPIPTPLETYAAQFDDLFSRPSQRAAFRQYLAGLLLPAERNKTVTALANVEPVVGAQRPAAQRLQWFLSESTWDAAAVTARRLELLRTDPATAPHADGVLIIDETGDRKDGDKTAHVGRQYLGNRGKTEQGVVSVSSVWADEGLYYPLAVEPSTPAPWFALGKADPAFRTKPAIALELVDQAIAQQWPMRAVVADCFYGEHHGFTTGLQARGVCPSWWRSNPPMPGGPASMRWGRSGKWRRRGAGPDQSGRGRGRRWSGRSATARSRPGGRWKASPAPTDHSAAAAW